MCSMQFPVSIVWKCIKYQEDTKRRLRMNTQTSRELRRLWDWYTIHAYIYKGPRHANECEEEDCGSNIHMLWNSIHALKPNCAETLARHTSRYCRISTDLISHCTVLYIRLRTWLLQGCRLKGILLHIWTVYTTIYYTSSALHIDI